MLSVVGVSHKSAPLAVRERLALDREAALALLQELRAGGVEAALLSTCNRVELYVATEEGDGQAAASEVLVRRGTQAVVPHLRRASGPQALRHLFRVACSLDSLVVGEPQILGQLKEAVELARGAGALGPELARALDRAVRVGKRVRSETQIGSGQVSVASVAVSLAEQIFGTLEAHEVALIGAGEMAEAAAKLLVTAGARLTIVNRSPERAARLAEEMGGTSRPWSELEQVVTRSDVVLSSTSSPGTVLSLDLVKSARKSRRGRGLFLIDIAVPRDVDPAVDGLDDVYLYDVDDLSKIVAESLESRRAEAEKAESLVELEAARFEVEARAQEVTPWIVGLRQRTREVLSAELERSLSGKLKHLGPSERRALETMVEAATNKLLHAPSTRLRALASEGRAEEHLQALRELFELDLATSHASHDRGDT